MTSLDHRTANPAPDRRVRMLHTADVHVDSAGAGRAEDREAHRRRNRRCLQAIVDCALAETVDVVLLAGDVFDHHRVPDEDLELVHTELQRLRCPVVILPGNHDCLQARGVYDRRDLTAASPHVRVITEPDGQTLEYPDLQLAVWGRAMQEHEPGFHPLGTIPTPGRRRWNVALGHGFFYPSRQTPDRSSPIFADEIRDAGWDYVALGHQHVLTNVSQGGVVAYYSGAPLGEGRDGQVLVVDLSPDHGVTVETRRLV